MPSYLLAFPIAEFSAVVTSWTVSSFVILNLTQVQVFAAPLYNFSSTETKGFEFYYLTLCLQFPFLFIQGQRRQAVLDSWLENSRFEFHIAIKMRVVS